MINHNAYIPLIIQSLKKVDPLKVYLFGSAVSGKTTDNSDIDIAVILDSDRTHKTYDEKLKTRVMVRESIMELSCRLSIDLLVYSKPEFEKLKEVNPFFAEEIEERGKVVYEKYNQ